MKTETNNPQPKKKQPGQLHAVPRLQSRWQAYLGFDSGEGLMPAIFTPKANKITGIYQTQDELKARRVLQVFTQKSTLHIGFTLKDGWYSILTDTDIPEEAAADFNDLARTVADTDIKAQHLGAFQQWEV